MINTTLGHYRILEKLGEGQIGTTYLAEDIRLERHVAIKILADRICKDKEWLERVREAAKTAALLNHAHIAQVYSIEESSEGSQETLKRLSYITMEYVPGKTLKEVIGDIAVPLEQALSWGTVLSDALTHAHQRGGIHGALAPSSIIIRDDQHLKILDFGLSRIPRPQGDPLESDSLSISSVGHFMTQVDVLPYLAPEHIHGLEIDQRSDVYSFGKLMFWMLTGGVPDVGSEESSSVNHINPDIPDEVNRIIKKCLQQDLDRRYQQMLEVRNDLETFGHEYLNTPDLPTIKKPRRISVAFLCGAVVLGLILGTFISDIINPVTDRLVQFEIPVKQTVGGTGGGMISSDGLRVVYVDNGQLWIRHMADVSPRELPGTIGARDPFWSPDNAYIGYIQNDNPPRLMKQNLADGHSVLITTLPDQPVSGIVWHENGEIILSAADASGQYDLYTVSAQSGSLSPMQRSNTVKKDDHLLYPVQLPDGKTRLYNHKWADGKRVDLVADRNGTLTILLSNEEGLTYRPVHSPTGHLVYQYNNSLWARKFDIASLTLDDRAELIDANGRLPAVSKNGLLIYLAVSPPLEQITRVSRSGTILGTMGRIQSDIMDLTMSPDNHRIAVSYIENENQNIGLHDDSRMMPFTFDQALEQAPAWSPDGKSIVYVERNENAVDLYRKSVDGSREAIQVTSDPHEENWPAWSPNGQHIVYQRKAGDQADLWYVSASDGDEPVPFIQSIANEKTPVFSPDGRYVAFVSDSTGRDEVYVVPFRDLVNPICISDGGGSFPTWIKNELFYIQNNTLMVVETGTGLPFTAGQPRKILTGEQLSTTLADHETRRYAISQDGREVMVVRPTPESVSSRLIVVQNWSLLLDQ